MRRRDFITLLSGAATWPFAAQAQQTNQMRIVGVLMPFAKDDPESEARVVAFQQGLEKLGWTGRSQCSDRPPLGHRHAKWLELLKEIAPHLTRIAYISNPENPGPMQSFPLGGRIYRSGLRREIERLRRHRQDADRALTITS